ncbi:hypothetical protein N9C99_00990 [Gammaproteobacteria bacterium]|jgi:hypothetical protein|nr:hypothetical protein [Gammaproteobacteria bacterium]
MTNIIDFGKAKLKKERQEYEQNLDTQIITTRREIETIALDIVMEFAELWEIDQLIAEKIYSNEGEVETLDNDY